MTPNSRSYINRFLQPDSIIPNPANPQNWNRYSYVTNRPVNFNDPSGHNAECGLGELGCKAGKYTPPLLDPSGSLDRVLASYGITTSGNFSRQEKWAILRGARAVGDKFAEERGNGETAADAFNAVYDPITINGVDSFDYTYTDQNGNVITETKNAGCKTEGNIITCANLVNPSGYFQTSVINIVHELGHVFDPVTVQGTGSSSLPQDFLTDATTILHDNSTFQWRINTSGSQNEEFANFFVAWVYDVWGPDADTLYSNVGTTPRNWMATNMSEWIP